MVLAELIEAAWLDRIERIDHLRDVVFAGNLPVIFVLFSFEKVNLGCALQQRVVSWLAGECSHVLLQQTALLFVAEVFIDWIVRIYTRNVTLGIITPLAHFILGSLF